MDNELLPLVARYELNVWRDGIFPASTNSVTSLNTDVNTFTLSQFLDSNSINITILKSGTYRLYFTGDYITCEPRNVNGFIEDQSILAVCFGQPMPHLNYFENTIQTIQFFNNDFTTFNISMQVTIPDGKSETYHIYAMNKSSVPVNFRIGNWTFGCQKL